MKVVFSLIFSAIVFSSAAAAKDLITGFALGLDQKDLTPDIMKCATAESPVVADVSDLINSLRDKDFEEALNSLLKAVSDVKAATAGCKDYSTDMQTLETNVETVASNLMHYKQNEVAILRNIIENRKAIAKDREDLNNASDSKDYNKIGVAVGDLCRLVLLNVNSQIAPQELAINLDGNDVLQFVEGFSDGLVNSNIEQPLQECWQDTKITISHITAAVNDFKKKDESDIMAGLKELATVFENIKNAISPCTNVSKDLVQLVQDIIVVVNDIKNGKIVVTVGKNIVINGRNIFGQIEALIKATENSDYKGIGLNLGDIVRELLLSFAEPEPEYWYFDEEMSISPSIVGKDVLQFVEGFGDGLVNQNIEQPLQQCWKGAVLTFNDLKAAVDDFKKKTADSIAEGLKELISTYEAIHDAVSPCTNGYADLKKLVSDIVTVVNEIKNGKVVIKASKNIIINGKDIIHQVEGLITAVEGDNWKQIGLELGDIVRDLLLSVENRQMYEDLENFFM